MFEFMKILQKKPKISVGLNIDGRKIDIVQVEKTETGVRLIKFMRSTLPSGAVEDGLIIDRDAVRKTIKGMMSELKIGYCDIATSVWGNNVVLSFKKIPYRQRDSLKQILEREAGNYLVFAGTEIISDYFEIESITDNDETQVRVLQAISRREIIDSYVSLIKELGCEVDSVGVGVFEDLKGLYPNYAGYRVVAVVVEDDRSHIFLLDRGVAKFAYSANVGSRQMLDNKDNNLLLVSDIENIIRYAYDYEKLDSIDKIVLSGNLYGLPETGIEDVLANHLEMDVEIGNPLEGVEIASDIREIDRADITRGYGLALGAAGIKTFSSDINLLPEDEIKEKELKGQLRHFFIGIFIILAVILLGFSAVQVAISQIKKEIEDTSMILNKPAPVITELVGIEKSLTDNRMELNRANAIIAGSKNNKWNEFLHEIKTIIPRQVRLKKLESSQYGVIEINGEASSYEAVFVFMENLIESPYFKDIELITAKDINKQNAVFTEFIITGKLFFYEGKS